MLSASEQYTLFFPLELTNKDYLRRIFETVAQGIKDRTVQISEDNQLRRFYEPKMKGKLMRGGTPNDARQGALSRNIIYRASKRNDCRPPKIFPHTPRQKAELG